MSSTKRLEVFIAPEVYDKLLSLQAYLKDLVPTRRETIEAIITLYYDKMIESINTVSQSTDTVSPIRYGNTVLLVDDTVSLQTSENTDTVSPKIDDTVSQAVVPKQWEYKSRTANARPVGRPRTIQGDGDDTPVTHLGDDD